MHSEGRIKHLALHEKPCRYVAASPAREHWGLGPLIFDLAVKATQAPAKGPSARAPIALNSWLEPWHKRFGDKEIVIIELEAANDKGCKHITLKTSRNQQMDLGYFSRVKFVVYKLLETTKTTDAFHS